MHAAKALDDMVLLPEQIGIWLFIKSFLRHALDAMPSAGCSKLDNGKLKTQQCVTNIVTGFAHVRR
jgi:hypothetical protein